MLSLDCSHSEFREKQKIAFMTLDTSKTGIAKFLVFFFSVSKKKKNGLSDEPKPNMLSHRKESTVSRQDKGIILLLIIKKNTAELAQIGNYTIPTILHKKGKTSHFLSIIWGKKTSIFF